MYALIDNATQQVLDFVNLGGFGSSVNIISNLAASSRYGSVASANDTPGSPLSVGALNQIGQGVTIDLAFPLFINSLLGLVPCYPDTTTYFTCPFTPTAYLFQNCSWQAGNPLVHYTVQDLEGPQFGQPVAVEGSPINLGAAMSEGGWSLGNVSSNYSNGAVNNFSYNLSNGLFQAGFVGTPNLPYAMWGSTNLIDWSQIGTVAQPSPGVFQFQDPSAGTYSNRFYQLRAP
jgi:hypothetical protein